MSDPVENGEQEPNSESKPAPVKEPGPEPAPVSETVQKIEQWFADHIAGSAVARNTECWNIVAAAKEKLKEILG